MNTINPAWPVLWSACALVAVGAAIQLTRRPTTRAMYAARASVGVLFVLGGALMHVVNLVSGFSYAGFADPAHIAWVRDTWRSVVPPNQTALIGLLAAFELAVGVLIFSGGRRARLGLVAAIAFHACLWIFGWIETIYCIVMIPTLVALLVAERRLAISHERTEEAVLRPPLAA